MNPSVPASVINQNQPLDQPLLVYRRLLGYLKPLRLVFALSAFGYVIFAACSALFAELLRQLIDIIQVGAEPNPTARVDFPLMIMVLITFRGLGSFMGTYFMAYVSNHIVHKLRSEIVGKFMRLPIPFYDRNSGGHLMSTITYNVSQVSLAASEALTTIFREGFTVVGLIVYLFYLNWKLTLVFLAVTPIISVVVQFASKKFRKHSRRMQVSMGDVTHILSETIKGLKVVRSFGAEQQVQDKFDEASYRNLRQNLRMSITQSISTPIIQFVVVSSLALLIWIAMAPERLAQISPGDFVAFVTAAGMLLRPIRQLSKVNAEIQRGLIAAQSIFTLLDEEQERDVGTHAVSRVQGRVEFQQVSFRYGEHLDLVLHEVSFVCEPGQTIAIVGKSGSGKSTLVNLIPRFYELQQGRILIDGVPNTEFSLGNLRSHMALVSQQVVLFNGSIRDNIAYGSVADASDEAILEALRNANAMEFIEQLPAGMMTLVGDDGVLLSGGQRQRLAIARALLKDAPILILDEATSALDTVSERYIQAALEKLMQGRTTFVIAHRLSTIENADRILVMHEGRLVESGTHQQLLALDQHYADLHRMQFTEQ